jgi:hypothetical protein
MPAAAHGSGPALSKQYYPQVQQQQQQQQQQHQQPVPLAAIGAKALDVQPLLYGQPSGKDARDREDKRERKHHHSQHRTQGRSSHAAGTSGAAGAATNGDLLPSARKPHYGNRASGGGGGAVVPAASSLPSVHARADVPDKRSVLPVMPVVGSSPMPIPGKVGGGSLFDRGNLAAMPSPSPALYGSKPPGALSALGAAYSSPYSQRNLNLRPIWK